MRGAEQLLMTRRLLVIPAHRPCLGEAEREAVGRVLESRWLGAGPETRQFEERLQEYLGARHVVAVATGTAALHLALEALDLQRGDEVLVPSLTFVATVQAIVMAGARPVFCEVREDTLNLDLEDALARITPRTRAILPVHYSGRACDLEKLVPAAHAKGLRVVEDAAHAFGSTCRGRMIGTWGDLTCFSFDAIKNITCGDGGAVATDNDLWAQRLRAMRQLGIDDESAPPPAPGQPRVHRVVTRGWRYHLNNIQAAIGLTQLDRKEEFRARKGEIVRRYDEELADIDRLVCPGLDLGETFPFHYVVRVLDGRRGELVSHLALRGIGVSQPYFPNHLQPAFAEFRRPLPVTERVADEVVGLPFYCELSPEEQATVIDAVRSFFQPACRRSPTHGRVVPTTAVHAVPLDRWAPGASLCEVER
jgi:perosamine synthetase